ncbi:MAG: DUF86 domain-containing protein [Rubrobacteraceae bacterium]|nr:DUF86 domain-containing protein [Rubrobacteraceae bacterium]MDQ3436268.1 DUF86 domain-containing protein [Actinomycetota bacterium]
MIGIVEDRRAEVVDLCERYGVKRLDLFGSAAGDGFDPEASDLDFVVSFERRDPPELFDRYFGLKEDLEGLFGRGVDLVTEGALLKDPDFAEGISGERTPRTLRQIADACSFVLSVTEGKTLEDYSGERLLRQGVERNLQIIGEAVGRLRRDDPETADSLSEHERIVGFRNVLVHGYDLVDDAIVWDTIRTKLPLLLSEVERLLEKRDRDPEEGEANR